MATLSVNGKGVTHALIWKCHKVEYKKGCTIFYGSKQAHWSTGFGFDEPVVINGNPELRQPEYETLTFKRHISFQVLGGAITMLVKV
jgi:hypothetical protein